MSLPNQHNLGEHNRGRENLDKKTQEGEAPGGIKLGEQILAGQAADEKNHASSIASLIDRMFDPEQFRQHGHALIDLLADQLTQQLQGKGKVIQWRDAATADQDWQQPLPQQATLDANALLHSLQHTVLAQGLAIHHPHNLGHQVATPLPMAALCDLVAALSNQAMAVYETGPSATLLERQVIRWLCALIDAQNQGLAREQVCSWQHAAGVLTSGGAQANLTALLAARQRAADNDVWKSGVVSQLRILTSEHAHYSMSRAAGIMGLGTDAVVKVATDAEGRMEAAAMEKAHQHCQRQAQIVMAVVATAGCTPTGSIDPLLAIGRYCHAQRIWLHVDGAHGASGLLSTRHRGDLRGIELADSVVWDGHKLLYMPAAVSAVLFRNANDSYAAFAQDASYLFHDGYSHEGHSGDSPLQAEQHAQTYNTSYRTLECTKRMMALKLWAAFSLYGVQGMAALVDEAYSKARLFCHKLQAHPAFELRMHTHTNIVCFRHLLGDQPVSEASSDQNDAAISRMNAHQVNLRQAIVHSGAFHLTQVELEGQIWLRTTLMNPYTSEDDLDQLLALIVQLACKPGA